MTSQNSNGGGRPVDDDLVRARAKALLTPPAERSDGQRELLAGIPKPASNGNGHGPVNGNGEKPTLQPVLVRASTIRPRSVNWLWQWWLGRGTLCVIDADPGIGKSTLSLDVAARLSRGDPMPTGPQAKRPPAATLLLCEEDDPETTVRPRLDAAGADSDLIHLYSHVKCGKEEIPVTIPYHLELVEEDAKRLGVALVVIDPLTAYLDGSYDAHKDHDIRRCLRVLANFARRTGIAVLLIRHLNKGASSNPLHKGGGSIGIIGAARSAHLVGYDPNDDTRIVLACNKSNIGPKPRSLAWRLVSVTEGIARVQWEGDCELKARDLIGVGGRGRPPAEVEQAMDWLRGQLAGGRRPAAELYSEAEGAGISERTLKRAKAELRVTSEKGFAGWLWSLPVQGGQNSLTSGNSGPLEPGDSTAPPGSVDSPRLYDQLPE